jgi:CheY-like chemotaxis protein
VEETRVLVAALPWIEVVMLRSLLARPGRRLECLADVASALAEARETAYKVVITTYPLPGTDIDHLVSALRRTSSASATAGVVLLVTPEHLTEASSLVGRGVNKVLSTTEPPEVIRCVVERLLEVGSPASERMVARLPITLEVDGARRVCSTENISQSGMLVAVPVDVQIGQRMQFWLELPGQRSPIEGEARVVRLTSAGREAVAGAGMRFCSIEGEGRAALHSFLRSLRGDRL